MHNINIIFYFESLRRHRRGIGHKAISKVGRSCILYLCRPWNFIPEWWSKFKFSSQNFIEQFITILRFTANQYEQLNFTSRIHNEQTVVDKTCYLNDLTSW